MYDEFEALMKKHGNAKQQPPSKASTTPLRLIRPKGSTPKTLGAKASSSSVAEVAPMLLNGPGIYWQKKYSPPVQGRATAAPPQEPPPLLMARPAKPTPPPAKAEEKEQKEERKLSAAVAPPKKPAPALVRRPAEPAAPPLPPAQAGEKEQRRNEERRLSAAVPPPKQPAPTLVRRPAEPAALPPPPAQVEEQQPTMPARQLVKPSTTPAQPAKPSTPPAQSAVARPQKPPPLLVGRPAKPMPPPARGDQQQQTPKEQDVTEDRHAAPIGEAPKQLVSRTSARSQPERARISKAADVPPEVFKPRKAEQKQPPPISRPAQPLPALSRPTAPPLAAATAAAVEAKQATAVARIEKRLMSRRLQLPPKVRAVEKAGKPALPSLQLISPPRQLQREKPSVADLTNPASWGLMDFERFAAENPEVAEFKRREYFRAVSLEQEAQKGEPQLPPPPLADRPARPPKVAGGTAVQRSLTVAGNHLDELS